MPTTCMKWVRGLRAGTPVAVLVTDTAFTFTRPCTPTVQRVLLDLGAPEAASIRYS